jgi:hypothetical protein
MTCGNVKSKSCFKLVRLKTVRASIGTLLAATKRNKRMDSRRNIAITQAIPNGVLVSGLLA